MKFAIFSTLAIQLAAVAAVTVPSTLQARAGGKTCEQYQSEIGTYNTVTPRNEACVALANACVAHITDNPLAVWSSRLCVAAAGCDSVRNLLELVRCSNTSVFVDPKTLPHLDYNVYATIVGSCAWAPGGCPITQQNFIDLIYAELTTIGSSSWPAGGTQVINDWWVPLKTWTATGDAVPYTNFDDWLHFTAW